MQDALVVELSFLLVCQVLIQDASYALDFTKSFISKVRRLDLQIGERVLLNGFSQCGSTVVLVRSRPSRLDISHHELLFPLFFAWLRRANLFGFPWRLHCLVLCGAVPLQVFQKFGNIVTMIIVFCHRFGLIYRA